MVGRAWVFAASGLRCGAAASAHLELLTSTQLLDSTAQCNSSTQLLNLSDQRNCSIQLLNITAQLNSSIQLLNSIARQNCQTQLKFVNGTGFLWLKIIGSWVPYRLVRKLLQDCHTLFIFNCGMNLDSQYESNWHGTRALYFTPNRTGHRFF